MIGAIMALAGLLAMASMPAEASPLEALAAATIPCQGDGLPVPALPHAGDQALCPLDASAASHAVILEAAPALPPERAALTIRISGPRRPNAPRAPAIAAAYPRGPPRLA